MRGSTLGAAAGASVGGVAGATAGYSAGRTPEERRKLALAGGVAGAVGGAFMSRVGVAAKGRGLTKAARPRSLKNLGQAGEIGAWHGSGSTFDKFGDLKKYAKTGEGAMVRGHGYYFANQKDIGTNYAKKLAKTEVTLGGKTFAVDANKIDDELISFVKERYGAIPDRDVENIVYFAVKYPEMPAEEIVLHGLVMDNSFPEYDTYLKATKAIAGKTKTSKNLYKVTLHKGKKPSEYDYLKWDEPVSDASLKKIEIAGKKSGINLGSEEAAKKVQDIYDLYGGTFSSVIKAVASGDKLAQTYREMLPDLWKKAGIYRRIDNGKTLYHTISEITGSDEAASNFLLKAGIDGVDFPAHAIYGTPTEGHRNYVVFDPNAISIESVENLK